MTDLQFISTILIFLLSFDQISCHESYRTCIEDCLQSVANLNVTANGNTEIGVCDKQCRPVHRAKPKSKKREKCCPEKCEQNQFDLMKKKLSSLTTDVQALMETRVVSCGVGAQKDGILPPTSFTASSYYNNHRAFGPAHAGLNRIYPDNDFWGGWVMDMPFSEEEWLQVDMLQNIPVVGIVTQGRGCCSQFVKSYKVSYSSNGRDFNFILNKYGQPKVFSGNIDDENYSVSSFGSKVVARYIRVYPVSWDSTPGLRVEILIC